MAKKASSTKTKNSLDRLTKAEFKELLLTIMVGVYVREGVLDSQGKGWQKIADCLTMFLKLAEKLGFSDLVENFKGAKLPAEKLCKEEEAILEEYNDEEFWSNLEVLLGQRDFSESLTTEERKGLKKELWLPEKVHRYYEKYRNEFEKYGIARLRIFPYSS